MTTPATPPRAASASPSTRCSRRSRSPPRRTTITRSPARCRSHGPVPTWERECRAIRTASTAVTGPPCHHPLSHTFDSLLDGPHTVNVRVYDNANNVAFTSVSFKVDTVVPADHDRFPLRRELLQRHLDRRTVDRLRPQLRHRRLPVQAR